MSDSCFQFPIRVYYEDTDAGGIVYYANYLKFCERARTEWLRALGVNQIKFLEQNIGFVVTKVAMNNIASARLDDLLTVTTQIKQLKRASIIFTQQIINQNDTKLCEVEVNVACVDFNKNKPVAIPSFILGALESVS
ncbi:tol-pal system-associated acyl-CoA thioesterase [Thalassotalea sp. LPB0316]|uniref:tol-pal system-associated acyl-CoA thioesterase n=1 Tax=Thalassotalea sp. LPB0316 TaxID=2769490 RepID=UPI00186681AD|nr:tol-pal system-associated acyl-CoA thioesterase [Thalassotalea sp. LPB0316]QOL24370.1 tol-pal system-associated acyl-CoA thioesterase [Thalassotalea sp. LPB0316]